MYQSVFVRYLSHLLIPWECLGTCPNSQVRRSTAFDIIEYFSKRMS